MVDLRLPRANQGLINLKDGPQGNAGTATRQFYDWMRQIATQSDNAGLQEQIDAILVIIEEIESGANFLIQGSYSVRVTGTPQSGLVSLYLQGDTALPGVSQYYGTNDLGVKGWNPLPNFDSAVPYFIPVTDTYTVSLYKQALFSMIIDVEGTLTVDGFLIEVN